MTAVTRSALARAGLLLLLLLAAVAASIIWGPPDLERLRAEVEASGTRGPALFLGVYVLLALVPWPKAVLTAAAGALFGLWVGAGLALAGALGGAVIAFGIGRLLGRDAVDRLLRGKVARVDALLAEHGLSAVLVVRLLPLVPFTAVNYASGLSGVRFAPYVVGSALGMIPGTLAYAALGAYGTHPWQLAAVGSVLIVLVVGAASWARRLEPRRTP